MIQFNRGDNIAINLIFDKEGLNQLIESLIKALKGEESSIIAQFDSSVVSMKRGSVSEVSIDIYYTETDDTQLYKHDNQLKWTLYKEDMEYAIESLKRCVTLEYFSPAEFIRVKIPKNKKLDYIYCELKL